MPLVLSAATWPRPPWDPIDPTAFQFPSSVTTVLTVRTGLQRTITGLFKDVRVPLTNWFLTVLVKGMSSGFSQYGWVGLKWQIHSNISVSLSLSIPSSTLNQSKGASLVAQWLRICLPMQRTRVRALVLEDPTCRRAAKPLSHNYWACASGACAPQQERPRYWEAHVPQWWVAPACRT